MVLKLMCSRYTVAEVLTFNLIYSAWLESLPNTCRVSICQLEMSLRSYSVHKDGELFKIQIKHEGRVSRNQKKLFVRGYTTVGYAERDIQRLDTHMQTMRVCTFEKQDGDEMDELVAPPPKRTRHQKDVSKLQVLSGIVFTRYRRSLSWKYHRMKNELVGKNAPVMSKEDWLKEVGSREVDNFAELDQRVRGQAAVSYLHQRLRVLKDRKAKSKGLLEDLRKCIYTGQSYTKIREAAVEEDNDVLDLTKDKPKFTLESTTKAQLNRVTV